MKKYFNKGYIILSSILILSLTVSSVCLHFLSKADNQIQSITKGDTTDYANIERDTSIAVDSNGVLQINRNEREKEISMGRDNAWTIFLYLCGSNLETHYQAASNDIAEIMSANISPENIKNVNIIIQTGGSRRWHSNNISSEKIQRYKVNANNENLDFLQELDNTSMGDPDTLYDFLDWGITNYPAEHMGVIFWNHGSGVSNGICADELYNNDSLSVHELEYTFAKLNKKMTSKFEMISFDTCLSGSLEYANLLAPYARYMIASADIESGEGWCYTESINYLLDNPDSTGAELGKVICDTYANYYDSKAISNSRPPKYTLATYDLSKAANVCVEANYLTKYLYDKLMNDDSEYWNIFNFRLTRLRYSTDTADIGSIIDYFDTSDKYDYNTTYFKKALDELIVYGRISSKYSAKKAYGITLYSPVSTLSLADLNNYRNICFSPYWLNLLEYMNIRTLATSMDKYQVYSWENSPYFFENDFNFLNYDNYDGTNLNINSIVNNILATNSGYSNSGFPSIWYNNILNAQSPNKNGLNPVTINPDMKITRSNNVISSQIAKINLNTVNAVYNTLFTNINGSFICLGQNNKLTYNKTTGGISSNFNEEWFMLPDGQLLTAYIISQDNESTTYSFPVMINDTESSIRVEETINNNGEANYTTLGVWDSSDNKYYGDHFARGYLPLYSGTSITPIYDVFDLDSDTFETEYGEEYIVNGQFEFLFGKLKPGEYYFAYEVEKINNVSTYSEIKDFLD